MIMTSFIGCVSLQMTFDASSSVTLLFDFWEVHGAPGQFWALFEHFWALSQTYFLKEYLKPRPLAPPTSAPVLKCV